MIVWLRPLCLHVCSRFYQQGEKRVVNYFRFGQIVTCIELTCEFFCKFCIVVGVKMMLGYSIC